ncbi:MAG: RpoL/Rpb11 RNA polymerase subunit family protein [Candidatus Micrarchaeia archaeon]
MKLNIKKDESKELEIEFDTGDLTLPDLLAAELGKNGDVVFAGVYKDHPEIGKPLLVLKTDKKKAKDVLAKTLDGMEEQFEKIKDMLQKSK